MDIKDDGNIILAYDSKIEIPSKYLSIDSKKATYDKKRIQLFLRRKFII